MSDGESGSRKGPSNRVIIILIVLAACVVAALFAYKAYGRTTFD